VFYDAGRGVWVARIELARDPDTGQRTRRKASAPTRSAARDLLDAMRAEKRKAGTVPRGDLTVAQVMADLLAHPPAGWKSPVTVQVNHSHAARITAALGRVKLAKLTPSQVERFLGGMAAAGLSRSTITGTRALLRQAIRRAMRDGAVTRNVADLADMPDAPRKAGRAFTLAQVRDLLAAASDDPWHHAYVSVAVMLGLRPGEVLGLRWADVDLRAGVVRVRHSLSESDGLALAPLKTEQSRRTLKLPAAVAASLKTHKRDQAARRVRLGAAWQDHDMVFPAPDGSLCSRSRAEYQFATLCERAGLGKDWTPYACRHTFCSGLSHGGVDIEVIADAMGHTNSNTTKQVYRHNMADQIAAAATAWDAILA
jgi:integrase